ncbi:MAG: TM0106 family RecB-like putative nuclease, partial [Humibacillus sp.]
MQLIDGDLVLSPTDLTKHVACAHITTLDLEALEQRTPRAASSDDALNLIFAKGLAHERDYLESLRAQGRTIEDIATLGLAREEAEAATLDAMRRGVEVIYQATFYDGAWVGLADFLLRSDRPSDLGPWSYDIADTKLARRLKVPALLQMATYAARLGTLQGIAPQWLVVVTGDRAQHPWRLVDVAPYARRRRAELEDAVTARPATDSVRVQQCGQCRWKGRCEQEWLERDDLIQVAGMRVDHRAALIELGIPTLRALAEASDSDLAAGLSLSARRRLQPQARLQLTERETGTAQFELLEPFSTVRERDGSLRRVPRGLALLPEPDEGDVYLDFEGDPWAEGGSGREYLAGIWTRQGEFVDFWAHDWAQEGLLTTALLDWLTERWALHPGMHVYHYAPYETTALKRLVGQHATREAELDQLLRHEVFVDLYAVVRQGVRISKGSYSIKKLEEFYWGHTRPSGGSGVADG